jgi:hypothetical protein
MKFIPAFTLMNSFTKSPPNLKTIATAGKGHGSLDAQGRQTTLMNANWAGTDTRTPQEFRCMTDVFCFNDMIVQWV